MELLSLSSPNIAARLAQLVEHQTFNLRGMRSNPISGSIKCASSFSNLLNSKLEKKNGVVQLALTGYLPK